MTRDIMKLTPAVMISTIIIIRIIDKKRLSGYINASAARVQNWRHQISLCIVAHEASNILSQVITYCNELSESARDLAFAMQVDIEVYDERVRQIKAQMQNCFC